MILRVIIGHPTLLVGLYAGGGDKYFFRLWKSGNQQLTTVINITIIISIPTTENLSIIHHHPVSAIIIIIII